MDCDLLILGDGPIAHSLVLALQGSGLHIRVIDTTPPSALTNNRAGQDASAPERSVALALASIRMLQGFGIVISDAVSGRIQQVQISQARSPNRVTLSSELLQAQEGVLGRLVPLTTLQEALVAQLPADSDNFQRLCWGPVADFSWLPDRVTLAWADGNRLSARLLVLADGGHGKLQPLLGLQRRGWDHNRYACTARVGPLSGPTGTAYEHFLESGPLAFLPRADGIFSLVWSLLPSAASRLMNSSDAVFLQELHRHLPPGLSGFSQVAGRALYPLHFQQLSAPTSSRILPLGNAAQTLHPLAGQGYNLGLRDAVTLAALLREAATQGADPGSETLLRDFQRIRRRDRAETIAFTEGMNQLFALPPLPWRLGREIALSALEHNRWLKKRLAARLAGVELPAASSIPALEVTRFGR
ncbi:2-octaprenyl-6-methoxyphenyl hydroxylase [Acidithiobacillus sp. CV18-2]|uniref:2-octaprenyl-6-methoxyphenyl hydroxylase n=1 Tax=Igneacidithiobacillus copahuensis TaxID=2724909 RepID=A0AAE2YSG1_9PROT|nr:FAD-dependent monooxygenase [Igneacidithiobacillus copahuensis]MBU2754109.1 2-octaprenyl-6-methoxyphenyl hydroxylase [Acidithiobacillus sp. CV18-3]MBU2756986.1 2-octaprenyl-6-methoxyphenyl hydroxylase [Acidithiobacillus sp. BN09-2]MBU2777844.1 2-octaprenyl-6-methoxyphenyl hydroxylase [Acidithiobacillus sp. CV18-2]MBU2795591.1 2-octaprenyl-6-methoxyphenyl hydroxylase [Acidithiobacillus sp. VAN18-2]MBU2798819.1 2-octaprenyl-6-methoxyphenyl hydroxylase [Acidithiobacillus sp. VAN18-4]UTV81778.